MLQTSECKLSETAERKMLQNDHVFIISWEISVSCSV